MRKLINTIGSLCRLSCDARLLDFPADGGDGLQPIILSDRDLRNFLSAIDNPPAVDRRLSQAMPAELDDGQ